MFSVHQMLDLMHSDDPSLGFIQITDLILPQTDKWTHRWSDRNNIESPPNVAEAYTMIWWLCLIPTSTTRFASDVGYRMPKTLIGYKEIIFMNNDIKFLTIEWRRPYPFTNFKDRFGLRASVIFLDSNMCGFLFMCTLASSQTLVVNWQNYLLILFHYSRFV